MNFFLIVTDLEYFPSQEIPWNLGQMKNGLLRDCIFDSIDFSGPHTKLRVNKTVSGERGI